MTFSKIACLLLAVIGLHMSPSVYGQPSTDVESPRIINIVNFIRQTDYRLANSDSLLFDAVQEQIKLVNTYGFPATFLFQYDALINPAYQQLMKTQLSDQCELGAWWEITQPHVEAAGIPWRGEHSWVSHANIAFTTGYTPTEREKLVDVYMAKFKEIYGHYPQSVASWFIDAHTLAYMHDKYDIVASANCKDQVGTDGYTLWGGYWNQAYYPSRKNAYLPAQHADNQIPVPIFRMLGSDPIYQYDTGLGRSRQGVISLEPVYPASGGDKKWVTYFLESLVNQPSLAFSYAQAGQENSFTWAAMGDGLRMQFALFDSLRRADQIRLETLGHSGAWFKKQFPITPATAVTALTDVRDQGRKTIWYNSRYYRTNLLWEEGSFRFRDIHLFDEQFESAYLKTAGSGSQFFYYALPLVDGFNWSTPEDRAGFRLMAEDAKGNSIAIVLADPVISGNGNQVLEIRSTDEQGHTFIITCYEDRFTVRCDNPTEGFRWHLQFHAAAQAELPFQAMDNKHLRARFRGFDYGITCINGHIATDGWEVARSFQLLPENHELAIDCTNTKR